MALQKEIDTLMTVDEESKKYFQRIYGDENRYEQILLNFVSNAIKFTDSKGKVEISLGCQVFKNGSADFEGKKEAFLSANPDFDTEFTSNSSIV